MISGLRRGWPKAGAERLLSLAAAPVFAIMALVTGIWDGGMTGMLCSATHASPLTGMVPMYLLMSAFHSAPWLRLMTGRNSG
jgi:formate-dependent nitrite reductase membrane component NrfD